MQSSMHVFCVGKMIIDTAAFPGLYRQRRRRKLSLFRRAPGENASPQPIPVPSDLRLKARYAQLYQKVNSLVARPGRGSRSGDGDNDC